MRNKCSNNVSYSQHRTAAANQKSALLLTAEYAPEDHIKKNVENVDNRVDTDSADVLINSALREEANAASSTLQHLSTCDIPAEEISHTWCETSRQQSCDVAAALASDMVNLYRNKVLLKSIPVLHSHHPPFPVSVSAADSTIRNSRLLHNVTSVQVPDANPVLRKRTVGTKVLRPLVSKSPFKLVNAQTVQSMAPFLKFSQAAACIDRTARRVSRHLTQSSTSTSSFGHMVSAPCSARARTALCSFVVPKDLSASGKSCASSSPSSFATSCANLVHGKSATTEATFTSSKYKLVRNKESTCRSASRQTFVTSLKDTNGTSFVANQVSKHSPSLLVVNKYKVVRKKRQSLTLSAKRTPNGKRMAPPVKSSCDVLPQLCRNSSTSHSKTRSNRYRLVRRNNQPHCTPAKPAVTRVNDRVQVLSKYKLVRRRSSVAVRTPQRATSTPVDRSRHVVQNLRILSNKHVTPLLFLNKYKLIRKRAMFKTNSSYCSNSTPRSSLLRKRRTRKRSFMTKYALQRSGQGRHHFLFM